MAKGMTRTEEIGKERMTPHRSCVLTMNGRTGIPKTCMHNFECWHCPFDQWIGSMEETLAAEQSAKAEIVSLARAA
jgi:hypothetical protein